MVIDYPARKNVELRRSGRWFDGRYRSAGAQDRFYAASYKHGAPLERQPLTCVETHGRRSQDVLME